MSALNLRWFVFLTMLLLTFFLSRDVAAQRSSYSHEQIKARFADSVQLVPLGRVLHLVAFRNNGELDLAIYNRELRLIKTVSTPIRIPERYGVQILPRASGYFIYSSPPPNLPSSLWKISEEGQVENLTDRFRAICQQRLMDVNAQPLLVGAGNALVMNFPFRQPDSLKMMFRLLRLSDSLNVLDSATVSIPSSIRVDRFEQIRMRSQSQVMMLSRSRAGGKELHLAENTVNDEVPAQLKFASSAFFFYMPEFTQPDNLGRFMVMARMVPSDRSTLQRLFLCQISDSLKEILHSSSVINRGAFHYVFPTASKIAPMMFPGMPFAVSEFSRDIVLGNREEVFRQEKKLIRVPNSMLTPRFNRVIRPNPLHFTVIDSNLNPVIDTLIKNEEQFPILPQDFFSFHYKNKGFVLLEESMPRNNMSFLLVYNDGPVLKFDNIPAYNRYDFYLSQAWLSPLGELYIPYRNKTEVGLMRLRIDY